MLLNDKTIGKCYYLYIIEQPDNIISLFDDLRYDRSDVDMVSPAMRRHLVDKLQPHGFKQVSGNVLEDRERDIRCIIPKSHALGASPFDITRYSKKRAQDYYVLTPVQTACCYIDQQSFDAAVESICRLIDHQPINTYKLLDYLERKQSHRDFLKAITYLRDYQKAAIEKPPLSLRRSLG